LASVVDGSLRSRTAERSDPRAGKPASARAVPGARIEKSARQVLPPKRQMAVMIGTAQPPPRRLRRAKHSRRIARRLVGTALEVAGFDG
jgi:hypothetical protein